MRADRHNRAVRSDGDRRRRPADGFRMQDAKRFSLLVSDALATLPPALLAAAGDAVVSIVDVPPAGAQTAAGDVPLARFDTAGTPARDPAVPGRLTVYRRPLELRALSRTDLGELVRIAVGREIARALGREAEFDDEFDDPDDW